MKLKGLNDESADKTAKTVNSKKAGDVTMISRLPGFCVYFRRMLDVICSVWLIGDMAFDVLTVWEFYVAASSLSGEVNPFSAGFLYLSGGNVNREAEFFYASFAAGVLPVPIGILIIAIFCIAKTINCLNKKTCGIAMMCGVVLIPGLVFLVSSLLVTMPIVWVMSPILHFAQAIFAFFGVQPVGGIDTRITGPNFTSFWLFVMFLKMIEQIFEAIPQAAITGVYLFIYKKDYSGQERIIKVTSLVFSIGSIFLFVAMNIYKCIFDYDNSMVGLLRQQMNSQYREVPRDDLELSARENAGSLLAQTNPPPASATNRFTADQSWITPAKL